jgi:hypothetical protein
MLKVLEMREAASNEREELKAAAAASMQALQDRVQCLQVGGCACVRVRVRVCVRRVCRLLLFYS